MKEQTSKRFGKCSFTNFFGWRNKLICSVGLKTPAKNKRRCEFAFITIFTFTLENIISSFCSWDNSIHFCETEMQAIPSHELQEMLQALESESGLHNGILFALCDVSNNIIYFNAF